MMDKIVADCPEGFDLTDDQLATFVYDAAQKVLDSGMGLEKIRALEDELLQEKSDKHTLPLLALKLATSRLLVRTISQPLKISVLFAVYKEHNRIRNRTVHPHGEDFLLKKVQQLEWLFDDQPFVDWELLVVDDGCPERSGHIANEIIARNKLNSKVRVVFLEEAIAAKAPTVKHMRSINESQKGGSIVHGMWSAIQGVKEEPHIVVYTDADLSTHLGQLMLLVHPLVHEKKLVAIGSRREERSVVIKKGVRNDRGKLFIYLWKRLIPNLGTIIDTQCGFKAFRAEIIPAIIEDMIEKKFAFDIELLLRTSLIKKDAIAKIPIAWIDSDAASTTTDLQPYLPMLKSIAAMSKKYFPGSAEENEFVPFLETLDSDSFMSLLEHIPEAIVIREPDEFTTFDKVRVADLKV